MQWLGHQALKLKNEMGGMKIHACIKKAQIFYIEFDLVCIYASCVTSLVRDYCSDHLLLLRSYNIIRM